MTRRIRSHLVEIAALFPLVALPALNIALHLAGAL